MSRKPIIYYRRCHVCGAVTEQKAVIEQCGECQKPIVPFLYYEDHRVEILSEDSAKPKFEKGQIRPILGLTAYW